MKAYLAAAFGRQAEIRTYRDQLVAIGHEVTSTWLDHEESAKYEPPGPLWGERAETDIADIHKADTVISFTDGAPARGGRHVEYGIAIALNKRRVIVGPMEHVFHCLPGAICVIDVDALMKWAEVIASFERNTGDPAGLPPFVDGQKLADMVREHTRPGWYNFG